MYDYRHNKDQSCVRLVFFEHWLLLIVLTLFDLDHNFPVRNIKKPLLLFFFIDFVDHDLLFLILLIYILVFRNNHNIFSWIIFSFNCLMLTCYHLSLIQAYYFLYSFFNTFGFDCFDWLNLVLKIVYIIIFLFSVFVITWLTLIFTIMLIM